MWRSGAVGVGPITFWIPPLIWLRIRKVEDGTNWMNLCACWTCIVLGILVTIVGAIGGLWCIVRDASAYHFFS